MRGGGDSYQIDPPASRAGGVPPGKLWESGREGGVITKKIQGRKDYNFVVFLYSLIST
jgi:hypothetical protein